MWLAQEKTSDREVVLDVVVERKRMDDLAQSITGGRFDFRAARHRPVYQSINQGLKSQNYDFYFNPPGLLNKS